MKEMNRLQQLPPCHLKFASTVDAILQVEVDQTLIRDASFRRHRFEIVDHILTHSQRDLLLQAFRIRISSRLKFREVVFSFHNLSDVISCLLLRRFSCRNDTDDVILPTIAVANEQQSTLGTQSKHQKTVFPIRVSVIEKLNSGFIVEDGLRFFKRNAMFALIRSRFWNVPLKT